MIWTHPVLIRNIKVLKCADQQNFLLLRWLYLECSSPVREALCWDATPTPRFSHPSDTRIIIKGRKSCLNAFIWYFISSQDNHVLMDKLYIYTTDFTGTSVPAEKKIQAWLIFFFRTRRQTTFILKVTRSLTSNLFLTSNKPEYLFHSN